MLGEFGDDPNSYTDAKSRRNYAGTSPLTVASGKKRAVLARHWTFALPPIAIGFRSALHTRPYTMPFSSTTFRVPAPGGQEAVVPDAERPNSISARRQIGHT